MTVIKAKCRGIMSAPRLTTTADVNEPPSTSVRVERERGVGKLIK